MAKKLFIWVSMVISQFQLSLGIALLTCGLLGIIYTRDQLYTQGPPYSVGAFLAGAPITIAGIISWTISRKAKTLDISKQEDVNYFACFIAMEIVSSVACILGSVTGLIMVAYLGFSGGCESFDLLLDTYSFHCNYTEHISTNKLIATFCMGFLIAAFVVSLFVICYNCICKNHFGVHFCRRPRPLARGRSNVSQANMFAYQTNTAPLVTNSGLAAGGSSRPEFYHSDKSHSCFNSRIQELEEENRLLQERIRLQQQQLTLQHQLREEAGQRLPMATPAYTPPPPSYEECTSDETTIRLLEDHNKKLQRHSEKQQLVLGKEFQSHGSGVEPSAPPQ